MAVPFREGRLLHDGIWSPVFDPEGHENLACRKSQAEPCCSFGAPDRPFTGRASRLSEKYHRRLACVPIAAKGDKRILETNIARRAVGRCPAVIFAAQARPMILFARRLARL
jgi:hypothetical protein